MSARFRLFGAAFLTDASLYLAFAALPFRALELGAGSTGLGILPTLYAVAYMATASLAGRWSDRVPRLALARAGGATFLVGCFVLSRAPGLLSLDLALPLLGLGLGFFWSPVQAALADRTPPARLSRAVMGFNVAWSLGKGTGLVMGGMLTETLDPSRALLASAVPVAITLLILPFDRKRTPSAPAGSSEPAETVSRWTASGSATNSAPGSGSAEASAFPGRPPVSDAFLRVAWMTNAIAFGLGSTMNVHAPRLLLARGAGPGEFGTVLGAVFLGQTLTFVALADHPPRRKALILAYLAGIVSLTAFLLSPSPATRIVSVLPLGMCLGLAYQASIHASLDRAQGRGKAAGLHEMLLGAGSSSLPLVGGAAATLSGTLEAPMLVGAVALGAGLLVTARARGGH